jgi:hypothetical protein
MDGKTILHSLPDGVVARRADPVADVRTPGLRRFSKKPTMSANIF